MSYSGRALRALLVGALALACAAAVPHPLPGRAPGSKANLGKILKLAVSGKLDAAYWLAQQSAQTHPGDASLSRVLAILRQRAVLAHLRSAHAFVAQHERNQAALQFRTALALDPSNQDARQGLAAQYTSGAPPAPDSTALRVARAAPPITIEPTRGRHAFHLRTALRAAVAQIASAYGLGAQVANDVPNTSLRLDIADADFAQAMAALRAVSGLAWIPLDAHTLYFGTEGELRSLEPYATRTFYLPWVADGVSLNQIANVLRDMLAIRNLTPDVPDRALTVRATPQQLDAAEQLLLDMRAVPGELLLRIQILQLDATAARDLGVSEPSQFTLFTLGPLLAQLQHSGSLSQDILNLFQQGGLNAVLNSGQLASGALAQAQSALSPLLQNPFVVFGGGTTLMAVSVPKLAAQFSATRSRVSTLETALLRAGSGQPAELQIGEKIPVINASFSPVTLNPALDKLIGNQSFIQPFPSFTYENVGLDAKMTPYISPSGVMQLQMDLSVSALTGETSNSIPIVSQRHLVTAVSLRNGVPVLVAGLFSRQEMQSLAGLPGLAQIPAFGSLFSTTNLQTAQDQLALLITPELVRLPQAHSASTWLPAGFASATGNRGLPFAPRFPRPSPEAPQPPQPTQPPSRPGLAPQLVPRGRFPPRPPVPRPKGNGNGGGGGGGSRHSLSSLGAPPHSPC